MFFQPVWSSTKCKFLILQLRLTGKNPFKAENYDKSMYRNYKCKLNFEIPGLSEETIFFLRQILSKSPTNRLSAEQALEDECF